MTKIRQDNNVTDCIDAVYAEIRIELSWPIRQGTINDEVQTG